MGRKVKFWEEEGKSKIGEGGENGQNPLYVCVKSPKNKNIFKCTRAYSNFLKSNIKFKLTLNVVLVLPLEILNLFAVTRKRQQQTGIESGACFNWSVQAR